MRTSSFTPIYVSKQLNKDVLNLLLMTEGEKQNYVLIKDFNSLMYNKTKHKERKYSCMHCLQCFSSKEILANHNTNCVVINVEQAIRMLQKGKNTLQFQNHHRQMPAPFVTCIYSYFEKGCRIKCTRQPRKVLWVVLSSLFFKKKLIEWQERPWTYVCEC